MKDDYLEKSADKDEQKTYQELMGKLALLQEEAKTEKEQLRAKAKENQQKEVALNKYQQIIRNIINANMLAKSGLKTRDEVIETKKQKIAVLDQEVTDKTKVIVDTEAQLTKKQEILQKQERVIAEKQSSLQPARKKSTR